MKIVLLFATCFWITGFVFQDEGRHKKKEAQGLAEHETFKRLNNEFVEDHSLYDLHLDSLKKTFCWKVRGDSAGRKYYAEEKRWNRYYKLYEVSAQAAGSNSYAVHVPMDSVLYYVCVKYYNKGAWWGRGLELEVRGDADIPLVTPKDDLPFTKDTRYEIVDPYGKTLITGFGSSIYVGDLPDGVYYLNYANRTTEFIRRSHSKKSK